MTDSIDTLDYSESDLALYQAVAEIWPELKKVQGQFIDAFTNTVPITSELYRLPVVDKESFETNPETIPVTAVEGSEAIHEIIRAYQHWNVSPFDHSRVAPRYPGIVILSDKDFYKLKPKVEALNKLKSQIKTTVGKIEDRTARWKAIHDREKMLRLTSVYRQILMLDNSEIRKCKFHWANKWNTKRHTKDEATALLEAKKESLSHEASRYYEEDIQIIKGLPAGKVLRSRTPVPPQPMLSVLSGRSWTPYPAPLPVIIRDNGGFEIFQLKDYEAKNKRVRVPAKSITSQMDLFIA